MLYSASNAKLKIDDHEIMASTAQLSLNASMEPAYVAGARHSDVFKASNGIGGQLSFNYYLTGTDYFKSFITGQGETKDDGGEIIPNPISGNFGGLNFDSGYLTSYTVNFPPNSPAVASASVSFFDELKGTFVSESVAPADPIDVLNFSNAVISSSFEEDVVDNFIEGAFNYSSDVTPAYLIGETKPSRVSFGVKSVSMNFEVDNPTGNLPVSGSSAQVEVALKRFNNVGIPMENWTLRSGPTNDNYSPFVSTSTTGDVSATWNGSSSSEYGIADSTPFIANENEIFNISFSLNLIAGNAPSLQLINQVGAVKKGWSTVQSVSHGSNSFNVTVSPTSTSTIIGTGNYAAFQIWNNSASQWSLTDLNVVRTSTQPSELFTCSGVMQSRNIASAVGDYIKQTINIKQNNSEVKKVFVAHYRNTQGDEGNINVEILA